MQDVKILGTDGGEVRVLLSLTTGKHRLLAETSGEWASGDQVSLRFDKFVVFEDGITQDLEGSVHG